MISRRSLRSTAAFVWDATIRLARVAGLLAGADRRAVLDFLGGRDRRFFVLEWVADVVRT
jgi:hypothetical protein